MVAAYNAQKQFREAAKGGSQQHVWLPPVVVVVVYGGEWTARVCYVGFT